MTRQRLPYPQPGRPLVPPPLGEMLGDELVDPWRVEGVDPELRWRDLDERVWRLPRPEVTRLAELVVKRLGSRLLRISRTDRMAIAQPVPLAALDLPPKIENALRRRGYIRDDVVRPIGVRDFALLRAVGVRSLLALLLQVQPLGERPDRSGTPARAADPALRRAAAAFTRRPWTREVSSRDIRFGPDVRAVFPHATTAAEAASEAVRWPWPVAVAKSKADQLARLLATLARARTATLPTELRELLAVLASPEQARALARRFGWDGAPPGTLAEAGRAIGVTAERVRQIQGRLLARIDRRGGAWTPALDRALDVLRRCRSCDDEALARRLRAAGVSGRSFTRDALLLAAEVFGKRERRTRWSLASATSCDPPTGVTQSGASTATQL